MAEHIHTWFFVQKRRSLFHNGVFSVTEKFQGKSCRSTKIFFYFCINSEVHTFYYMVEVYKLENSVWMLACILFGTLPTDASLPCGITHNVHEGHYNRLFMSQ